MNWRHADLGWALFQRGVCVEPGRDLSIRSQQTPRGLIGRGVVVVDNTGGPLHWYELAHTESHRCAETFEVVRLEGLTWGPQAVQRLIQPGVDTCGGPDLDRR